MKKVVLFANSTWCIYNFRLNLIRNLLKEGCEVHILSPLDHTYENSAFVEKFQELGATFHELPLEPRGRNPLNELRSIYYLFRLFARLKPDMVLSYTVKCNLYAGFCRQILGFPQVANVPGLGEVFEKKSLLTVVVSNLYRLAFRGMTKAFFQNHEDLDYCLERKLVPESRCVVIPGSGVDLSRFAPTYPPCAPERRIFLMFGRLLPQKGYLDYLDAARELKRLFGPTVECWVMGIEDKNRRESGELVEIVRDADSEGIVRLLPAMLDVLPILSDVDVVVLPSRYNEGIPRSLLEAMAAGKAIITSDWRGCRLTVEHGRNGLLVPVRSVPDLTQAMIKLATMPASELREFGRQGRILAEQKFDEKVVVSEYLRVVFGPAVVPMPSQQPAFRASDARGLVRPAGSAAIAASQVPEDLVRTGT